MSNDHEAESNWIPIDGCSGNFDPILKVRADIWFFTRIAPAKAELEAPPPFTGR
jgi:hypothetical protein